MESESEVTVEPLQLNGRGHKVKHGKGKIQAIKGDEARLWIMSDFVYEEMKKTEKIIKRMKKEET